MTDAFLCPFEVDFGSLINHQSLSSKRSLAVLKRPSKFFLLHFCVTTAAPKPTRSSSQVQYPGYAQLLQLAQTWLYSRPVFPTGIQNLSCANLPLPPQPLGPCVFRVHRRVCTMGWLHNVNCPPSFPSPPLPSPLRLAPSTNHAQSALLSYFRTFNRTFHITTITPSSRCSAGGSAR